MVEKGEFRSFEMNHNYEKEISGCGISGLISKSGEKVVGEHIIRSICNMDDRGNGLGSGFAAYGIYPQFKNHHAFHLFYDTPASQEATERYLEDNFQVDQSELIPTRRVKTIENPPGVFRYFLKPRVDDEVDLEGLSYEDFVVRAVMHINANIEGAYVFSSGKNMGAFKGVGLPGEIADFFCIDEYEAYIWTAHNRFPTNTPGWWGGAHPFTLLDWSIIHNGEISSYGINKRYLEMYGYRLTLLTDTEVVAYLLDLLIRKHKLNIRTACMVLATPFWKNIELLPEEERKTMEAVRMVYGSALLNGPFAILFGHSRGLVGLNDRIKLRPLVAAVKDDFVYMASEESAIREICSKPDKVWAPKAGEPVIAELDEDVE
jgi:glutamate synthase domain-containing protein 1